MKFSTKQSWVTMSETKKFGVGAFRLHSFRFEKDNKTVFPCTIASHQGPGKRCDVITAFIRSLWLNETEGQILEYQEYAHVFPDPHTYQAMCWLHENIFQQDASFIKQVLSSRPFLILIAVDYDNVVGYKIGYQDRPRRFYSWFGGVDPTYRGRGIASELMRRQHLWCRQNGYQTVRTYTKNKWRDMLILNLRHGFDVIGTYTDSQGEPKIILEKRL